MRKITVQNSIQAPIEKVWEFWTKPEHIVNWTFASDDWEAPHTENDVRVGGKFKTVMAVKDKSTSFDFTDIYTNVKEYELIEYDLEDGRQVKVEFTKLPTGVRVTESFESEKTNPKVLQRDGWQMILDNFKNTLKVNKKIKNHSIFVVQQRI